MNHVAEYLVIIEKETDEGLYLLCKTATDLNKLVGSDPDIKISDGNIQYGDVIRCRYSVSKGQTKGKNQRFFHIKIEFDGAENHIIDFTKLLRSIKKSLYNARLSPESLRDDISLFYSKQAYPLIHQTENLMRKLITYFMLTNIGKQWVTENIPKTIEDAVEKSKRKSYIDFLHQLDFIHLGDILFKPYSNRKVIDELFNQLDEAQTIDDLNLHELQEYVPRSNWDKYFSDIVDCDDQFLRTKWNDLYELRCKIAHNAPLTKNDLEQISNLSRAINSELQRAIDNLDKIQVPEENKEEIAENVVSSISTLYGSFIQEWKLFETAVQNVNDYLSEDEGKTHLRMPSQLVMNFYQANLIPEELLHETKRLSAFRNQLVHDPNFNASEGDIQDFILRLKSATKLIRKLAIDKNSSWREEIILGLKALDEKAKLTDLYSYIKSNTSRNLAETWKATIRYTLQRNPDVFVRVSRGIWKLRDKS